MLVLCFHVIGGNSCTIHKALHYSQKDDIGFDATKIDWKVIILGTISALKYLHDHDIILHNDIKADNIISLLMINHLHINVLFISVKVLQLMEGHTPFLRKSDVDIHWNTQ